MNRQTFRIETKLIDKERRIIPSKLSDPGRDRMGEEIAAGAWKDLPRDFPILWQHNQAEPAIARGWNPRAQADGLTADLHFPPPGVHERADLVFDLIGLGILTDLSVGFLSHKQEVMPDGHLRHVECELLEASVVNVGANPRASVMARALGYTGDLAGPDDAVLLIVDDEPPGRPWRSWEPASGVDIGVDIVGEVKMVPPNPSGYGHQDEAARWEAPTMRELTGGGSWSDVSDDERRKIGKLFAYSESWPPKEWGHLHLPHHVKNGDVNHNGVANALARLSQVGGMSAEDRAAARRHLEAHLEEFKKDIDPAAFAEAYAEVIDRTIVDTFNRLRGRVD